MTTRIVLAEDNQRLAAMLQVSLEALGHRVIPAADGIAALAALQGAGADLLILDLKLPGMSGIDLLQKVRRAPELRGLPVMVMSGVYRGEGYRRSAGRLGVRCYLEKPFRREEFLRAVRCTMEQAPPRPHLIELLARLYRGRKSGSLHLSGGARVSFLGGEPVSFSSPDFIPFLLSSGRLMASDLECYPQQGAERLQLTEAGLLSYHELLEQSRLFLSATLTEAMEHNRPASFAPETGAVELPLTPVSLPRLMHEAARWNAGRFELSAFLDRHAGLYPAKTPHFFRLANLFSMGREEIEVLELLARGLTLEAVVAACADRSRAASFLNLLMGMGMISLAPSPAPEAAADFPQKRLFYCPADETAPAESGAARFEDLVDEVSDSVELPPCEEGTDAPPDAAATGFEQVVRRDYAQLRHKNYYETFSLSRDDFNAAALKEAYFSRTRRYSPEQFMELSGAVLARAQDVLSHYANAYNTLSNPVAKGHYDDMLSANGAGDGGRGDDELQRRIQLQSGKAFLEMGDFNNAERALQEAYNLDPQDPHVNAYLAWSIYKNPSNAGSRAARDKCRMLLSRSLQLGRCPEAFSFRGFMLLDEGRDGLAEGEFLKALKLDARERSAQNGIRLISERRGAEKNGLFRRIFC